MVRDLGGYILPTKIWINNDVLTVNAIDPDTGELTLAGSGFSGKPGLPYEVDDPIYNTVNFAITPISSVIEVSAFGNYPPSGQSFNVKINDEIMQVTSSANGAGVYFWTVLRGLYNTTPASHNVNDAVVPYPGSIYGAADFGTLVVEGRPVEGL